LRNIHPIVEEVLNSFFNPDETKEFISRYLSNEDDSSKVDEVTDTNLSAQFKFKLPDGLKTRSQIDLLITFSEANLSQDKLVELLLFLGQSTITSGEYTSSVEIHNKIISLTKDFPEMLNITANAYFSIGEIFSRQAQWDLSFFYLDKAIKLFGKENNLKGNANCENLYGTIYGDMGNLEKAIMHFENALAALEGDPDNALAGKIEINLGIVNNMIGNYDEALSYLKRALLKYEKIGEAKRVGEIRQNLGMVYTKKKEFTAAVNEYDLSLEASIQSNYLQTIGISYLSKAYVYSQLGDYLLAEAFAEKAMEISYKINDKLSMAEVYKIKGIIKRSRNEYETAENYLLTSLRLNKELDNQLNYAESSYELGLLYRSTDQKVKSQQYLSSSLEYYKKINAREEIKMLEELLKQ